MDLAGQSKIDKLKSKLVCPDCRVPLKEEAGGLACTSCGVIFPNESGVPKLYSRARAREIEAALAGFRAPHAALRGSRFFRALIPPSPVYDPGAGRRHERIQATLAEGVILNLGSKSTTWGEHVINVDLVLPAQSEKRGVDLLADMERLPFADESADGVICTFVLEHVRDAAACLDEIRRVLRPGGYVYATVPFIFPTHPDPLDRWRWTLDGLRHALWDFEELEAGPCGGPCSAYVSVVPTLAGSAFSNFYLFNAIRCSLGWLLWPVKFLDFFAARSARAYMTAPDFFFFGRKKG